MGVTVARDQDFTEYASTRATSLKRSALLLGCTDPEAEDLVQTTLMRCYASWDKVTKSWERDPYVYRVLVNTHTSSRRRRWWAEQPTADLPEQSSADATSHVDEADALRHALAALTAPDRAAVVLRYYAQLSEAETAQALGIPRGTVKSRLSRALAQLSQDPNLTRLDMEAPHE